MNEEGVRGHGAWRRVAGCVFLAGGVGILLFLFDGAGGSLACGFRPVRVEGRLVDAAGAPRAGVWVMTLPSDAWKDDVRRIAEARLGIQEGRNRRTGGTTTGADGSFAFEVEASWCRTEGGLFPRSRDGSMARYADARWLLVWVAGGPVYVDATQGAWTQHGEGDGPFATLDLGSVRVE